MRAARTAIVAAVALGVVGTLLWVLKAALTPLAAAFAIAYLLDPLIDRFEARRLRHSLAIFLLLGLVDGGVLGFLLFVIPRLVAELAALADRLPQYLERLVTEGVPALEERFGVALPKTLDALLGELRGVELTVLGALRDLLAGTVSISTGTVGVVVALLVIPILAYYPLVQFDAIVGRLGAVVPPRHRAYVFEKVRTADRLISGVLRGELRVAACLGVLHAVGFGVIGIDLAVGVGLHPAAVIVALLIGGDLFGFLGVLIAVPAAAIVKVFADEALAAYRSSSLFGPMPASGPTRSGVTRSPRSAGTGAGASRGTTGRPPGSRGGRSSRA